MVANTEPKNRFIARWTWYSTLLLTHLNLPATESTEPPEASKGDRRIHAVEQCLQRAAFILVTAITAIRWIINQIACTGCYGQTVYRDAGRHHHCHLVLVDKQTLMRFGLDQQKYANIAAEINATSNA